MPVTKAAVCILEQLKNALPIPAAKKNTAVPDNFNPETRKNTSGQIQDESPHGASQIYIYGRKDQNNRITTMAEEKLNEFRKLTLLENLVLVKV